MAPYDDFESVAEPALSDFESVGPVADFQSVGPATTETGGQITAENYGRVAAARIAKARRERETAGQEDLNQNEQAAIMDAYRQVAGLPTLSNVDTFKEAQKHIAEHQSAILNLARSTSAAFERQAVDLVSPAVDLIAPGWGTSTRQDIAAMNPYQSDSVTGKIGGLVASAPLILAGGSMKAAAGIFGLESAAGSLATSEDTGVTGEKKWGAAAGEGAITAGSILAGGKLGEPRVTRTARPESLLGRQP
jgi:hypothetical protein